jgi:peroxin-5
MAVGYGMNMNPGMYASPTNFQMTVDQSKGKGKGRDADFEAAFARVTASLPQATVVDADSEVTNLENALANASLDTKEVQDAAEENSDLHPYADLLLVFTYLPIYFISALFGDNTQDLSASQEELAKWEAEFSQLMNNQRDEAENDLGAAMQQAWENGNELGEPIKFDDEGLPLLSEYVFGT